MAKFNTITLVLVSAAVCGLVLDSYAGPKTSSQIYRQPQQTVKGDIANPLGHLMEVVRVHKIFTGNVINHGKFKTTDATVTFARAYTEHGAYFSDPSTNYFTDLIIGTNGYLNGGTGDLFIVSGNFINGSTQNTSWSTSSAELDFEAGISHQFSLAGADVGATTIGYANNFAWGTVRLYTGQSLVLADGNANPGAALYTNAMILDGGTAQISSITGNGYNIYYNPLNPLNSYLGGNSYALQGGGFIMPTKAGVKILSISVQTNKHVILHCVGVPSQSHTVQSTTDLNQAFTPISTAIAGSDGTFQYEDSVAGSFPQRFYRISYP